MTNPIVLIVTVVDGVTDIKLSNSSSPQGHEDAIHEGDCVSVHIIETELCNLHDFHLEIDQDGKLRSSQGCIINTISKGDL